MVTRTSLTDGRPPLMMELGIHKNIIVSVTKLTLGLRVSFISSQLTADKLFTVKPKSITGPPKMSMLEMKKTSCIDHQTTAYPGCICILLHYFAFKIIANTIHF